MSYAYPTRSSHQPSPKPRIYIDTARYEAAHSHKPSGRGRWVFEVGDREFKFFASYSAATKAVRDFARRVGVRTVAVLP